ncbi:dynein heavy chain, N-terminal region 1-domain-containing protein [Cyathus striatus]|nr:dynein heavy chain, N-terminal region 1-domain-containing protein [Cyathus striatus]
MLLLPNLPQHPPSPAQNFDPEIFRGYLRSLLPPVVGAQPEEERVLRFVNEPGGVVYVVKVRDESEDDSIPPTYTYHLTPQLMYHPSHATTLALIKRSATLDPTAPLATQLHFLNLFGGDETPYESLHAVVSHGVKPWFDAFVGARGGGKEGDSKMGSNPMTKKKFAELELSLLHLQQNVEIPETHLLIHPSIQRACSYARSNSQRPSLSHLPQKLLNDSSFLNTLHAHVNGWIKAIQEWTASQEINFWLSLERALEGIETQLRSEEVGMVMDCLRNAKRFHATVSFIADTGLKDATDLVIVINGLDKTNESILLIFSHLNRKLRLSPYPIRRALPLVEAISKDFNDVLLRILTSHRLPYTPYETFDRLLTQTMGVFRTWDEQMKEFTNVAREVTRKRAEKFIPIKVLPAHGKLMERVRYLKDWRKQHEQLAVMTGEMGMDMEEEVKEAYEVVKRIDVLDVSTDLGCAENAYNERVSRARDRLGTARNANEMFRVFSKFNALFVRPKIRGAIQEYQTQLIDSVKEDIKRLHDKFKTQYRYSEAYHMAQMRDLPPIAGAIIWARQIERQLLRKGWELYAEGQKLQSESSAFRKKLDTRPVFDAWLHDINRRNMGVDGRLFEIVRLRAITSVSGSGGTLTGGFQLAVNFDPQIITLFKEVRNLLWLGFQVPHAITNMARMRRGLMETVRTYGQTLDLVERNKGIEWLVAEYRNESQRMIAKGMNIRWDYFINQYDSPGMCLEFASVVSVLQDKTNSVIDLYKDIMRAVEDLATCSYTTDAFSELLGKVQAAIDRLNLEGYANLDHWVAELDKKIESILLQRLTHIIQVWCAEFDRTDDGDTRRELPGKRRGDKRAKEEKFLEGNMVLKPIVHEIRIQNQVIFLDPPIEYARSTWIRQLHDWIGIVCRLHRIQSSRYEIGLQMQGGMSATETTYTSLLTQFTDDTLERPFALVENKVQQLKDYVAKWLQFQSLWDLEAEYKSFGVCVIDYEQVQARVNAKYDAWQRDILSRFGVKLGNAMKEMHASILKARNDLEHHSIEGLVGGGRFR